MNIHTKTVWTETLPDPLPENPVALAAEWLAQARLDAAQPNPHSMVLSTVDSNGQPSARVVLCKGIEPVSGCIIFYTNYQSRKGRELAANPRAAITFHWDHRHRQVRAEGLVQPLAEADSDAYFATRPWQSRLGAWASAQSQPVESRGALAAAVAAAARRFGIPYLGPGAAEPESIAVPIPRPPQWGGYRLRVEAIELWVEGAYRIHDRARWTRRAASTPNAVSAANRESDASDASDAGRPAAWTVTRLQP